MAANVRRTSAVSGQPERGQPPPVERPGTSTRPAQYDRHNIHEQALNLHTYRMQLIASNIANADTPNYKEVDFNFKEALRRAQSTGVAAHAGPNAVPLQYHVPQQASADGNTVELDVERAKFVESAVRYEFSLDRVGGHYKMMMELLSDLKD
jgi:flagellar basal-body rod protein FlgB